ncbi:META domain-containing protein [Streptomyces sp. NPDC021093]|uniref:META domain-containing protein n=1 Tax=Streptomyces sp. NPDC021093 TaxID=3365112 RepID=UPI0037A3F451
MSLFTRRPRHLLIPAILLLALTACSGNTGTGSGDPLPVPHVLTPTSSPQAANGGLLTKGIRWYVTHTTNQQGDQGPEIPHSYFFIEDDDSVRGNLGCHDFTGRARWKGKDTVVFTDFVREPNEPEGAAKPCSNDDKSWEENLHSKLTDVELNYRGTIDTGDFYLDPDGDPYSTGTIAIKAAPHSPTLLTDQKRWSMDAVVTGFDGNSKTVLAERTGGKPWIEFGKDGSVAGDTGCSEFEGTWTYGESYDTVKFSGVRRDGGACDAEPASAMGKFDAGFYKLTDGIFSWTYQADIRALDLSGGDEGTLHLRHKK